jgi:hypothetical protein
VLAARRRRREQAALVALHALASRGEPKAVRRLVGEAAEGKDDDG